VISNKVASDPVQGLFVEKIREYATKKKLSGGKLVDSTNVEGLQRRDEEAVTALSRARNHQVSGSSSVQMCRAENKTTGPSTDKSQQGRDDEEMEALDVSKGSPKRPKKAKKATDEMKMTTQPEGN
jgi:hypothetical protein